MPKCLCEQIPEILQRITVLEVLQQQASKKECCCECERSGHKMQQIEEREAELNQRLEANNKKTQMLNQLAQKMVEEMKLLEEVKQPATQNVEAELEDQQKTLENMDKLFDATTKYFLEMYKAVAPYYNLPELQDTERPTVILQGLEHIMRGVSDLAKQMSSLLPQK